MIISSDQIFRLRDIRVRKEQMRAELVQLIAQSRVLHDDLVRIEPEGLEHTAWLLLRNAPAFYAECYQQAASIVSRIPFDGDEELIR